MANHAARRAPAPTKTAPVLKLTADKRRQNNMSVAKRASLLYITTLCGLLERKDAFYEAAPIGLSILDARSVFGTWNQTFPTYIRLVNLRETLRARVIGKGDPTLESITLLGIAKMAHVISVCAMPEGATAEMLSLHEQTLEDVAPMFEGDRGFASYRETRTKQFKELFDKLR